MNKRGVVGQTVSTIPVMIGVFLIMALFIAGSFAFKGLNNPKKNLPESSLKIEENNPLLKTIEIQGERGMILDLIVNLDKFGKRFEEIGGDSGKIEDTNLGEYDKIQKYWAAVEPSVIESFSKYSNKDYGNANICFILFRGNTIDSTVWVDYLKGSNAQSTLMKLKPFYFVFKEGKGNSLDYVPNFVNYKEDVLSKFDFKENARGQELQGYYYYGQCLAGETIK